MKKYMFFLVAIIVVAMSLSSCGGKKTVESSVQKTVETTIIETSPGSGGVVFSKEITVKNGETIWGYSQEVYGNGSQWRDIVAENKFLQEPGRVYFDTNRKRWIAKIYPGEIIKIGGQVIAPTYIFSEKITTTAPIREKANLNWLWISLGVLGLIVILAFIAYLLFNKIDSNNSTGCNGCHCGAGNGGTGGSGGAGGNACVHINVAEGQNFDLATENGMLMARHNRVCQMTESVSSQMISKQNISDADLWANFSSNGEINFHIRANYREEKEETK